MLKLFIGNKAYSSWSLRGWLAVKQSGLPFDEAVVPLYDDAWATRRRDNAFAPSRGKVPILWDGDVAVWDSLAIIEWLADRTDRARFWTGDDAARAMARSMAAEMHSSYQALRQECVMNLRHRLPTPVLSDSAQADIARIQQLWTQARARYGAGDAAGRPFLFGAFGAADIMFAPVVTRFVTYSVPAAGAAADYMAAVLDHPWMREWISAAAEEPWVIDRFEPQRV